MKIIKWLWYLCHKSHSYFPKGHWHYSPMDGYLNGNDNKPHRVYAFIRSILRVVRNGDLMYKNKRNYDNRGNGRVYLRM